MVGQQALVMGDWVEKPVTAYMIIGGIEPGNI
jgi:hypothetical protein